MVSRPFPKNVRLGLRGLAAASWSSPWSCCRWPRERKEARAGHSESVDRPQEESDENLTELIRAAVANHPGAGKKEIREVTRARRAGLCPDLVAGRADRGNRRHAQGAPGSTSRNAAPAAPDPEGTRTTAAGAGRETSGRSMGIRASAARRRNSRRRGASVAWVSLLISEAERGRDSTLCRQVRRPIRVAERRRQDAARVWRGRSWR